MHLGFDLSVERLVELLGCNDYESAYRLCDDKLKSGSDFSYYRFWRDRLSSFRKPLDFSKDLTALNQLIERKLSEEFSELSYNLEASPSVSGDVLESRREELVRSLPVNGEIYLPTNKIPLKEQVEGLDLVRQLYAAHNKQVTSERFARLKSAVQGLGKERVFVIGNGPSLKKTDMNLLRNEVTIGFNSIFLHPTFSPTILVVEDHLVAEDRAQELEAFSCPIKIFPSYLGYCLPVQNNTIFLNHLPRKSYPVDMDLSTDVGEVSYTGGTVTYTGLQIALSLGFKEIYLIGVDASYTVQDVKRSEEYGTGVLESKSDDVNHFDPSYFGKGYRWHDPNVHTMLQAYRKVKAYSEQNDVRVENATIGGELEVFSRKDYYSLFPQQSAYPKTAILDFTHVDWLCATGVLKNSLLKGWPKSSLLHVHAEASDRVSAYRNVSADCSPSGADLSLLASLRALIEFDPSVLYLRPTHDRHLMTLFQLFSVAFFQRPYIVHYMDDWLMKIENSDQQTSVAEAYGALMSTVFQSANRVCSISIRMKAMLEERYKLDERRVSSIHNFIHPLESVGPQHRAGKTKLVRYFGGLEPDMTLESVKLIASELQEVCNRGRPLIFELFTSQYYREKFQEDFKDFSFVRFREPSVEESNYKQALSESDLNLLCYNFDANSERYLKYSLANKLPDLLSTNVPFIAIGGLEVGTIDLLNHVRYPYLVTEPESAKLQPILEHLLSDTFRANERYEASLRELKEEFSAENHLSAFQYLLREVATEQSNNGETNRLELIRNFDHVASLTLGEREKEFDIQCLKIMLTLGREDRELLMLKVREHGISWHIKDVISELKRDKRYSLPEILAVAVVSTGHERYKSDISLALDQQHGFKLSAIEAS